MEGIDHRYRVDCYAEEDSVSTEGGTRAVVAAMIANGGIAVTKFGAFAVSGSSSMLSEAIHSVADTGNQALLLIGGKRAQRQADERAQFGYGRARYVYAFVVAIVLFALGGCFSLYEGWHKWQHPEVLTNATIPLVVLGIAIALESWSFRTALKEANKSRGNTSLFRYIRQARQPELPVVLLEDTGALLGLIVAFVGVWAAQVTGNAQWDGLGAMTIGALLVVIALFLAVELSSMLIGEGALPQEHAAITAALTSTPGIERLIHIRTLHVGPDDLLVGAKVAIARGADLAQIASVIDAAEAAVRRAVPTARYVYLEPDLDRGV